MAQSFKNNNCFGANRESIEAGDYIQKKKARATYCNSNVCIKKNTGTYENYSLLHTAQQLDTYNCYLPFNKYDLNRNLFTQLDTSGVCVLRHASNGECVSTINPLLDIYDNYIIDSSGALFGNTVCGLNNFVNLMVKIPEPLPLDPIKFMLGGLYTISSNEYFNRIITFNGNGIFKIYSGNPKFNILVVGGGGSGGESNIISDTSYDKDYNMSTITYTYYGGGGAGGQVISHTDKNLSKGLYTILIGNSIYNNNSSSFENYIALPGANGTNGRITSDANGNTSNILQDVPGTTTSQYSTNGTNGTYIDWLNAYYGGAGAGAGYNVSGNLSSGGIGGGANGVLNTNGIDGTPNTGGGGGGAGINGSTLYSGGNGGSGVVIIAFNV